MSAKRTDKAFFEPAQEKLIRESLLAGAPEFEIERFLITCERTGLDPFSRQIYGNVQRKKVKRQGKEEWIPTVVIITSIDGFRAIAERSGEYRGQTPPEWYYVGDDGKPGWHDVFIPKRDKNGNPLNIPEACRVGAIRQGFAEPCYGVANFDSFAAYTKGEDNAWYLSQFWKKMPEHMIAKVAEAQAIRKAFPLLACGLFVEEEIGKDEDEPTAAPGRSPTTDELPEGMTWAQGASPEERKAKAAAKAVETPAPEKPSAEPVKPAEPKKSKPAAKPEPEQTPEPPEEEPEEKEEEQGGEEWEDYAISQITIAKFTGKKLSELTLADIEGLKTGWVDKYAEKIKLNPAKATEAAMITAAYNALKQ